MIYQLPTGEIIEMSLDEYLSVSDKQFSEFICQNYSYRTSYSLPRNEYGKKQEENIDLSLLEDDEIKPNVARTLNQIIDSISDED